MRTRQLSDLQVIAVRHRRSKLAEDDERSVDAYKNSGVYSKAGVPFSIIEPEFPEHLRSDNEPANIGELCGRIADLVAGSVRQKNCVVMTGGDCTHTTGVLGGLQDAYGPEARIGLVWLDAHGDSNTQHTSISGMLGGMPVAVCAGLTYPEWREKSHIVSPLPTDRIILTDVRNLDEKEEMLIRATDMTIASPGPELSLAVEKLTDRCDMLYLHIDSDILNESYVPNHGTKEKDGPDMKQVYEIIDLVMSTKMVAAYSVVSVYGKGEGFQTSINSGIDLIGFGLDAWKRYGMPDLKLKSVF